MTANLRRRTVLTGLAGVLGLGLGACGSAGPGPTGHAAAGDQEHGGKMQRISYGAGPSQFAELSLPGGTGPFPVVVVVHGGFWSTAYGLELGRPLAADLAAHGVAAWNVEYRRVGRSSDAGGGGWPATGDDLAAAVDKLAAVDAPLDLERVVALGHSAGGQLAGWLAGRSRPAVAVTGVVSQAGVLDLVGCATADLGNGAAQSFLGGEPDAVPDVYASASPLAHLPLAVPVTCVHGTADGNVPIEQSQRFVAAAQRSGGAPATLQTLDGVDHFGLITVGHPGWQACRDAALALLR